MDTRWLTLKHLFREDVANYVSLFLHELWSKSNEVVNGDNGCGGIQLRKAPFFSAASAYAHSTDSFLCSLTRSCPDLISQLPNNRQQPAVEKWRRSHLAKLYCHHSTEASRVDRVQLCRSTASQIETVATMRQIADSFGFSMWSITLQSE